MSNLSVRGLEPETLAPLKALATREGSSVNALVLRLIERGLGRDSAKPARRLHDDLDALAGSWTAEEAPAFDASTGDFEATDPELWK
jgi:hypothetical protein